MLKKGDKIAIVCCSNGEAKSSQEKHQRLHKILEEMGLIPVWSDYIYRQDSVFSGSAQQRADALMHFYQDEEIKMIFDISGGDLSNEILPYLNYEVIAQSEKMFWGYSDLTTIINAIYAKTGKVSVLYQIRNVLYNDSVRQIQNVTKSLRYDMQDLFDISYKFVQGEKMHGIVVGGNIRCFLKLAGTPYMPDVTEKILLLEAYSGDVAKMVTYLNQLKQMGVFEKISGILLGTYTEMEREGYTPDIVDLVKQYVGEEITIVCTKDIGHGTDSKAIMIGKEMMVGVPTIDEDILEMEK